MDELARFNQERWNDLVRAGVLYARPALELHEESARDMVDNSGFLKDVTGKRVLLLAGGGGQQAAAFGILGAQVTVLDLSDEQLAQDQRAADHYGFTFDLHQGDMRDLSRFDDGAFDIVWQPYSINFVPDVRPVFAGVARVLQANGLYRVQWANPYTQTLNDADYDPQRGYAINTIYADGEINAEAVWGTNNWTIQHEDNTTSEVPGPREFRHTMPTFINSLIANGFVILAFDEHTSNEETPEPGSWEHYKAVSPPYLAFWTRHKYP